MGQNMSETQSTPVPQPEKLNRFYRLLARIHIGPDWEEKVVRFGFWTSWGMIALVLSVPWMPTVFGWFGDPAKTMASMVWLSKWIGFAYLGVQYATIAARDPLSQSQTLQDHLYSLISPVIATFMWVLPFFSTFNLTKEGWEILNFWMACGWLDFFGGLAITNKMFTVRYQRIERETAPH